MPDTVEHDRTDGHLARIRLTARLGRDKARKQIDLRAGHAAGAARISAAVRRQSQRLQCLRTGFAVGCEAVFALKGAHVSVTLPVLQRQPIYAAFHLSRFRLPFWLRLTPASAARPVWISVLIKIWSAHSISQSLYT